MKGTCWCSGCNVEYIAINYQELLLTNNVHDFYNYEKNNTISINVFEGTICVRKMSIEMQYLESNEKNDINNSNNEKKCAKEYYGTDCNCYVKSDNLKTSDIPILDTVQVL